MWTPHCSPPLPSSLSSLSPCSNPIIPLSQPFVEQLENISSNLCELLLGVNEGELSLAVLSRGASVHFRRVQGAPVARGDLT